jgi:hypothetical protein
MVTATGICIGSAGEPLLSGLLFLASTPIDLPPIGAIPYSNCRRAAPSLLPTLTRAAGPYLAPLDLLWSASWQIEARNSKLALGVYAHELRHCIRQCSLGLFDGSASALWIWAKVERVDFIPTQVSIYCCSSEWSSWEMV